MGLALLLTLMVALPLAGNASVVSDWNKVALAEVRLAKQGPPTVARSLAIAHTCMYDTWASYSEKALGAAVGGTMLRRYNPDNLSLYPNTPSGLGNSVAVAVIASRQNDGSNQYGDLAPGAYKDYTGYVAQNAPLPYCSPQWLACSPLVINDEYKWQPLYNDLGVLQTFIAPHWERVKPFALTSADQFDDLPS